LTSILPAQRTDFGLSERNPMVFKRFWLDVTTDVQVHMHYPVELGFLFKGSMERIYPDGNLTIRPGDIWLTGVWEPHAWQIAEPGAENAVFHILPECLATLSFPEMPGIRWLAPFMAPPFKRPQIPPAARDRFLRLFEDACALPEDRTHLLRVRLALIEILLSILDYWKPASKAASELAPFDCVNRAIETLFETRTFLSAQEMASRCGMSRNRFHTLFQEYMGLSFPEFGLRYRLSRTDRELTDTRQPIKAIAQKWGFADVSHFYRQFERFYRCTPREYRLQVGSTQAIPPASS
jgi:AraC-like DNA-binding protein